MTETMTVIISAVASLIVGGGLGFLSFRSYKARVLARAQEDAQEILQEIQDELELVKIEQQEKKQEIELELWTRVEGDLLKSEEKIEDLQTAGDEKKKKLDDKYSQLKNQQATVENARKESSS
jgi:ribonucrease Y